MIKCTYEMFCNKQMNSRLMSRNRFATQQELQTNYQKKVEDDANFIMVFWIGWKVNGLAICCVEGHD